MEFDVPFLAHVLYRQPVQRNLIRTVADTRVLAAVLGMTRESSGREGTLSLYALRCMEGLGGVLLPGKAEGSGHRHCAVPGMEGGVPAMNESCVSAAPDMNEL